MSYLRTYVMATQRQKKHREDASRYHRLRVKALKGLLKDHTSREVGKMVGLSHSRVLQMVNKK